MPTLYIGSQPFEFSQSASGGSDNVKARVWMTDRRQRLPHDRCEFPGVHG
jgi:hypothetical protein